MKKKTQKRSDAQIKAIRRSYAIRASKAKKEAERKAKEKAKKEAKKKKEKDKKEEVKEKVKRKKPTKNQLNNYTQIALEYEKDKTPEKKLSDHAKKRLNIKNESVDPKVLDNKWNVHYFHNNEHPKAIITSNDNKVLTLGITSEPNDTHAKVKLQDNLSVKGKKLSTYMKLTTKIENKKQIYKIIKDAQISNRDKVLVYDSMKDGKKNIENYKEIKKKD